jgi:hypothetical protein
VVHDGTIESAGIKSTYNHHARKICLVFNVQVGRSAMLILLLQVLGWGLTGSAQNEGESAATACMPVHGVSLIYSY